METGDGARPASDGDGAGAEGTPAAVPADAPAGDGPPPAKRRKTRLACQECRDRKVRCDGARPVCGACARKRVGPGQCIFIDVADPQQAPDISPLYVRSLEERIRELERAARTSPEAVEPGGEGRAAPLPHHAAGSTHQPSPRQAPRGGPRNASQPFSDTFAPAATPAAAAATSAAGASHPAAASPIDRHMAASQLIHMQRLGREETADASSATSSGHKILEAVEPGSAMGATESTPTESGRTVFLGRSSAAAFVREVRESSSRHRAMSSIASEGAVGASPSDGGTCISSGLAATRDRRSLKKEREELEALMEELVLPPRRVADAHLSKYWDSIHPLFPVLHKPSFVNWYETTWGHGEVLGDDNAHAMRTAHARLNIVLALGCSVASALEPGSSSKRSAHVFYERSRALLSQSNMDHGCSMQLVQAYILTAQYLQATDLVNGCWVAIGTAIRAAQGIGVNEDHPRESEAEREERRRTWWGCIMMDRVVSMILGRPSMVAWKTIVPMPLPVDDELLSTAPGSGSTAPRMAPGQKSMVDFYVHTLQLTETLTTVLDHFYAPHPDLRRAGPEGFNLKDLQRLHDIDLGLARWRARLPSHLRVRPHPPGADHGGISTESAAIFARQAVTLHGRYLHLRILLFRPTTIELSSGVFIQADAAGMTTDFQRGVLETCVRSCVSAANELIALVWERVQEGTEARATMPWWYAIFYLYTAGTVVLAVLLTPNLRLVFCRGSYPEASPDARGEPLLPPEHLLQESWATCVKALSVYQQSGSTFAKRCLWILRAIHDQRAVQEDAGPDLHQEVSGAGLGMGKGPAGEPAAANAAAGAEGPPLHQVPLATATRPATRANGSGTITPNTWQALANAAFEGASALGPAADHHGASVADDFLLDLYWPAGNMDWLHNQPDGFERAPAEPGGAGDVDLEIL